MELQQRGNGIRAAAVIIDFVVWASIGYLIALATGGTTAGGFELQGGPAFLWFLSYFAYYVFMEGYLGWTVGKKAVGIKVVGVDGEPIGLQTSVVRNVLRVVDGLFFYLVGAVFVWRSESKQRLGDRVAETYVVSA